MRKTKPLDISKALSLAALFQFLFSAGKACVIPFITIYFRQLGLTASFVGIIIGTKHIIRIMWVPLCSYIGRRYNKRRLIIIISLFSSMGAGLLLTVIQPLNRDTVQKYCDISTRADSELNKMKKPDINMSQVNISTNELYIHLHSEVVYSDAVITAAPKIYLTSTRISEKIILPPIMQPVGEESSKPGAKTSINKTHESVIHSRTVSPSVKVKLGTGQKHTFGQMTNASQTDQQPTDTFPRNSSENESADQNHSKSKSKTSHFSERDVSFVEIFSSVENPSKLKKKASITDNKITETLGFLDQEHQLFLMLLMIVAFWEFLSVPPDWIADDGVYDYLDFIDAADRYGRQWIWGHLGAAGAACGITVLVDNLNCFLKTDVSRVATHFYGYAVLLTMSLLVSVFIPMHVAKKTEAFSKTFKAFSLIIGNGRTVTTAVTAVLIGATGSTVHNFLFWQMQNTGSSEIYMGASISIALLAEVLLYFCKNKVLKSVSYTGIIGVSLLCSAAQLLYYSFLWAPWSVLPIQVFSAFSNGAFWWAVYAQSNDVASPGMERPIHRALHELLYGVGASIGSFAGGFLIDRFGLTVLYRACCITMSLWAVVLMILQSKMPRQKRLNYSRLLAADDSEVTNSDEEQERDWLVKAMKDEKIKSKW
ncbi:major facilitator superfamily domain-containing protein 6-like [Protopterus annectens]|uniref:major facilitator superfamily domain-containing protein 6-like n=1 Tax=Protopterus annectens TaxID=7888 RepID=UPI001CFAD491|nr:major facilitator superfamily domain-containing protein 6-like [Protopterus annectens]